MSTKLTAYQTLSGLVERFDEQKHSYKRSDYNETLARRDFIDPFFKALGWDIDNSQGYAEAYREVIHEDKVRVGSATKAPDYSFRLPGGRRLFFVEAKKPSVAVKTEMLPAYQVRRYAWSAKLPLSILTDFEEFAIYDCNQKPKLDDKASTGRIKYLTYTDYLAEFEFIWDTFSKERVLKGSFDQFVRSDNVKKGTTTVDQDFLASLDKWRLQLAQNIALRNPLLDEESLNFAVQQTLDRIIFLRIAEDRGVEEYGRLRKHQRDADIYKGLFHYFLDADEKYNSGLFDFRKDKVSAHLKVDNKVVKGILQELYYPISPYEFSVINVEILGSAYEQFLGKQIKLTGKHKVVIDEKPEVRKVGGVYYTPQYIVDYIVGETVGKLVDGKKPEQVAKLKIVDPACGSGSFLLGVYQYLLQWHQAYYKPKFDQLTGIAGSKGRTSKERTEAIKERNKLPLTPDGVLTTAIKKKILLQNIYGVDIDVQAVEVTKLSLLLKCMEGETASSLAAEMRFGERILPTLDHNIKSGNSLIDLDFYESEIAFAPDAEKKLKPFRWEVAFPHVFKAGGFDAVVGNPPYRLMQPKDTDGPVLDYFKRHYPLSEFKVDLFHLFYQKGIRILKEEGLLGFITPSSLLNNVYVENLRKWLLAHCHLQTIALTKEKVFADADVYTAVYILQKCGKDNAEKVVQTSTALEKVRSGERLLYSSVKQKRFLDNSGCVWNLLINERNVPLLRMVQEGSVRLGQVTKINRGLITGDRDRYFSATRKTARHTPILAGSDVFRYYTNPHREYVLFEKPKGSGGCWDKEVHFAEHKLLIRQIGMGPTATYVDYPVAVTGNLFTIRAENEDEEKYILAILNSRLIAYYWQVMFSDFKNSFPQVTAYSLESIPIKVCDGSIKGELIKMVDVLLDLHQQKAAAVLPQKQESLQQYIAYTETKINTLVYKLYALTAKDNEIIEEG